MAGIAVVEIAVVEIGSSRLLAKIMLASAVPGAIPVVVVFAVLFAVLTPNSSSGPVVELKVPPCFLVFRSCCV